MGAELVVRQMYLDGLSKWPLVKLALDTFEAHCHRVLGSVASASSLDATAAVSGTGSVSADTEPREGADLFLCCACAVGDPEALRAFAAEAMSVARSAISRIERDPDFVQETLQEVWDRLLVGPDAKVAQYSGRGPLLAWVRVSATRAALDRCRARGLLAARHTELTDKFTAQGPSPELALTRARYGRAFQKALRNAVAALSAQERNVLRMHVAGQCSIDEIGRAYNVHRATAARWLERSRARIYEAVRRELSTRHAQLTDSEFKSLAHVMGSELELSLTGNSARHSLSVAQSGG
jgi:RNA polymerase sigma-70 factor (ECF subfamily)